LLACAPLIFFLYSFGRTASSQTAFKLAGELYTYAVTEAPGPLDGASVLGGTLRSWGIPVALPARSPSEAPNSPAELSLVSQSTQAILSAGSVRVVIKGYRRAGKALAETISADVGRAKGDESLTEGKAEAVIRLTPGAAFLQGDPAGLSLLLGLPQAVGKRAGGRWIEVPRGTNEYRDLAAEDTIAALPASILPLSVSGVHLATPPATGSPRVLSWKAPVSEPQVSLTETLFLASGTEPLPISERTVAGTDIEVANFSRWGDPFMVQAPPPPKVVPYSVVAHYH
jgi:hypothetical protein